MGLLKNLLYFSVHPNQLRSVLQWKIWHDPVIQELNPELLVPVALFYLILRGLDTIEDDMTIPLEKKEPLLRAFDGIIEQDGWTFNENGPNEKDRELCMHFDCVITEFKKCKPAYKNIIKDITKKMGNGMADYANNAEHNINGVNTIKDYELYCHYVAGLVGDGLTRLFVESQLANPALLKRPELSESMGQFLQKTNIIRDIREDFDDKRRFWPKEIWSKHVDKFDDLFDPQNRAAALACSSEMVLNSLSHADECLFYMANPAIFEKNVKITKGDACQLMMESSQNLRTRLSALHVERLNNSLNLYSPSQDPKAIAIQQAGETTVADKKSAAEEAEAKKRRILPSVGSPWNTICHLCPYDWSSMASWSQIDVALSELKKGNFVPSHEQS
ncbi:hypothetical protein DID88_002933 [Monilinia fructigena]|uniref:Squalene synthase n=1 Tax=Monilinia fructigena TaxID=38457 RepID=A0A395INK6_9HELO|nr:hypothetical protein DID88_002933 [Monilinia fructigena]